MDQHILVIEDDKDLREVLRNLLTESGYLVRTAEDGVAALKLIEKIEPDLVLLDLGLPNLRGETVCRQIKEHYPNTVVIMLTGMDASSDVVKGLNLGADDYVTKPFDFDELKARVKARLRSEHSDFSQLSVADLSVNTESLEVRRGNRQITLTPQEYKLLEYLLHNKGRVLTREMILSRLWRGNPDIETRVVDVYIGYLRKKIDTGFKTKLISSVRGFGYKISESSN